MSFIRLGHLTMGECDPDTGQCLYRTADGQTFRWTGGEQPRNGGTGGSASGFLSDPFAWFKTGDNALVAGAVVFGSAMLLKFLRKKR